MLLKFLFNKIINLLFILIIFNISYLNCQIIKQEQNNSDNLINLESTDNKFNDNKEEKSPNKYANNNQVKTDLKSQTQQITAFRKLPIVLPLGESEIRGWIKIRMPEFFYGKNLKFLNNDNPTDRVLYFRHVVDLNVEYKFINKQKNYDILFTKVNIRSKGVWGDPESIAFVTANTIKFLDSVIGEHHHAIPRHIFWMRELWMQISLSDLMHIPFGNDHTLTFGLFPFELGRGIALGAAFTVDPTDLGFYAEAAVDQYAPGAKISGAFSKQHLFYDIYASILQDRSVTFNQTNENVRGQEFGHRSDQARGFGVINYLVAARFKWIPLKGQNYSIHFEPYAMYNHNPEQKLEFISDATIDVISLGFASEAEVGNFEWGFDTAFNLGGQVVKGFDSNNIKPENRKGYVVQVNSKVRQIPEGEPIPDCKKTPNSCKKLPLALYVPENQDIINISEQSAVENCQIIGQNSLGTLINDCTRFVNPYVNRLKGSMFVFDFAYSFFNRQLKFSWAIGYASGGPDPNKDLEKFGDAIKDSEYFGFIGLQEVYSGTRVRSAFLLNGPAKFPRLLAVPADDARHPYPTSVSRFTNIVYVGTALDWRPKFSIHKWNVNPNLLFYWQEHQVRFYSKRAREITGLEAASNFLGIELNAFIESELLDGLKFFALGAVYFPGQHYKDIKGIPLSKAQEIHLDNKNKTGIIDVWVPLLGTDTAYFANIGFEYKF